MASRSRRFVRRLPAFFLFSLICCVLSAPARAAVPARSAILVNRDTGRILYAQHADIPVPPASLAKVMTLFLALDAVKAKSVKFSEKIRISRAAADTGGSSMYLRTGERVPFDLLLSGMAVASGNDAAVAVAQRLAGGSTSRFVTMMNRKAAVLGMRRTLFKTPNGLPALGQQTTARDMMLLARAYLRAHPAAARFHAAHFFLHRGRTLPTTNSLLNVVDSVDGLKTGWTQASGYNIIVTAQRGGVRLLAVVLGAKSRDARDDAVRALLESGFRQRGTKR
ncbi:MAG: D-alanyl-D-alanine carboxypeptidase [Desulfovibrio sp.]|nr:D-alanyl-D-alanine carboxypeptidase [Desulfovibrio sp.]